ncbi:MAG: hypothetical protein ACYC3I_09580 [Gemmataceae bacterium]
MDTRTVLRQDKDEQVLEQLQAIETGYGPQVESALLLEHLKRGLGLAPSLTDPTEAHDFPNPLARINAYKHRLHALRCDYANARLRTIELEEQLAEARLRILRLETRVKHLDNVENNLQQIYESSWWKVKERFSRWFQRIFLFGLPLTPR